MRIPLLVASILQPLAISSAFAQQGVDSHYSPRIERPAYVREGPIVAIDEAHRNFHTLDEQFAPFGKLLRADGYRVRAATTSFSAVTLSDINVLVISNARPTTTSRSAFSAEEIVSLKAWVEAGGSLLLISDHAPFGSAAADLARAFGADMGEGYVTARQGHEITSQITFTGKALASHPILLGRGESERIRRVKSFTGQSIGIGPTGAALLTFPADAVEVAGSRQVAALRQGQTVSGRQVGGRAQVVALSVGKGRVVVAGEAAMFTAQLVRLPNGSSERVGLTVDDDQQFALNTMHWLSRAIE